MRSERKSFVIEVSVVGNLLVAHGYNLSRDKQGEKLALVPPSCGLPRARQSIVSLSVSAIAEDPWAPPLVIEPEPVVSLVVIVCGCQRIGQCMSGAPSHAPRWSGITLEAC